MSSLTKGFRRLEMHPVEIKGLTKYCHKARGIEDIDLSVKEGEIFGFIGPNGAGKSTTIRLLLDLIRPTKGEASILGLNCFKNTKEIKRLVGYLPSEINYYDDMSIKELLEYSAKFYGKNCDDEINRLCSTFDVDKNKKFYSLSLGNKKKAGIIQALIHKPRLLIMDEPTSGLDPLMQNKFFDVLDQVNNGGCTIFFSSHVLSEVQRFCHRVGFIKEGRIIKLDSIENLRKQTFRKVKLDLDGAKVPFNISGARDIKTAGRVAEFIYTGEAKHLINELCQLDIKNILIEEPSLEDVFMHYYGEE